MAVSQSWHGCFLQAIRTVCFRCHRKFIMRSSTFCKNPTEFYWFYKSALLQTLGCVFCLRWFSKKILTSDPKRILLDDFHQCLPALLCNCGVFLFHFFPQNVSSFFFHGLWNENVLHFVTLCPVKFSFLLCSPIHNANQVVFFSSTEGACEMKDMINVHHSQ